jgi:hypothetical protein
MVRRGWSSLLCVCFRIAASVIMRRPCPNDSVPMNSVNGRYGYTRMHRQGYLGKSRCMPSVVLCTRYSTCSTVCLLIEPAYRALHSLNLTPASERHPTLEFDLGGIANPDNMAVCMRAKGTSLTDAPFCICQICGVECG